MPPPPASLWRTREALLVAIAVPHPFNLCRGLFRPGMRRGVPHACKASTPSLGGFLLRPAGRSCPPLSVSLVAGLVHVVDLSAVQSSLPRVPKLLWRVGRARVTEDDISGAYNDGYRG